MIGYVLKDIRPFIVLGSLMIITFGTAFRVLFADPADSDSAENCVDEDGGHGFSTLWLSYESTFHAILGQFESEVAQEKGVLPSRIC